MAMKQTISLFFSLTFAIKFLVLFRLSSSISNASSQINWIKIIKNDKWCKLAFHSNLLLNWTAINLSRHWKTKVFSCIFLVLGAYIHVASILPVSSGGLRKRWRKGKAVSESPVGRLIFFFPPGLFPDTLIRQLPCYYLNKCHQRKLSSFFPLLK